MAPSPPSSFRPPRIAANARVLGQRLAHRASERPGADAVDDHDAVEAGEQRIVEMGVQPLERSLDPLAMEVEAAV